MKPGHMHPAQEIGPGPAPSPTARRVVAVTGAAEFIGGEVIRRLERDPRYHKVLAIDIRPPAGALRKTSFHRVDLTMPAADTELTRLLRAEQVDTVLHAAFLSSPTHNVTWAHELEAIGTMHVLSAARACPVHQIVLWSQTIVYGATPGNPNFITEDHEPRTPPRARFILDKREAERQALRLARENPAIRVTVLRTAALLGPCVRSYVTRFLSRPACPVLMGFDPLVQFVHEQDAVDAFVLALGGDQSGVFNIVGDGVLPYTTVLALLGRVPVPLPRIMALLLSRALWTTQVLDTPPEFLDFLRYLCVADGARARAQLGFAPRHDIRQAIADFAGLLGTREVRP